MKIRSNQSGWYGSMFYIALTNNILYLKSQSYREMIDMEWKGSADHGNPLELEKGKPCVTKLQNEKLQA